MSDRFGFENQSVNHAPAYSDLVNNGCPEGVTKIGAGSIEGVPDTYLFSTLVQVKQNKRGIFFTFWFFGFVAVVIVAFFFGFVAVVFVACVFSIFVVVLIYLIFIGLCYKITFINSSNTNYK